MAHTPDIVRRAQTLVEYEQLEHPFGALLVTFIQEAVEPEHAATLIIHQMEENGVPASRLARSWESVITSLTSQGEVPPTPTSALQSVIKKRDGNKCCISGSQGSLFDPLVIVPVLKVPTGWTTTQQPLVGEMLEAFFGDTYKDWWFDYIQNVEDMPVLHTHWLLRRSVARIFEQAFIRLNRTESPELEVIRSLLSANIFIANPFPPAQHILLPVNVGPEEVQLKLDSPYLTLDDQSDTGILTVHRRFINTHARLSRGVRLVDIAKTLDPHRRLIDTDRPTPLNPIEHQTIRPMTWGLMEKTFGFNPITSVMFTLWRCLVPQRARVAAYKGLQKLGEYLYGRSGSTVQKLPFGCYLKVHKKPDVCRNEFFAFTMLKRRTSIPGPKPLDVIYAPEGNDSYILMGQVRGMPLIKCMDAISDNNLDDIAHSLAVFVQQLRNIPNDNAPGAVICDTVGQGCKDIRLSGRPYTGPFLREGEFNQLLMFPDYQARYGHEIFFTHAELTGKHILVDRVGGKWIVTGVVDWKYAGFYPVYWEYTKSIFEGYRKSGRYNYFFQAIFSRLGDYSAELELEMTSWEEGDHRHFEIPGEM